MVAFSCKGKGVCPSYNCRLMAQTAAHQNRSRDPAGVHPAVGDLGAQAKALWLAQALRLATAMLPRRPARGRHLAHEDFSRLE